MTSKTISINPGLFTTSSKLKNKTRKNQIKSAKPLSAIAPNNLKRDLINRVRAHQKSKERERKSKSGRANTGKDNLFADEFKDSLDYLVHLSREKQEQHTISDNKTHIEQKQNTPLSTSSSMDKLMNYNSNLETVNIDLPNELVDNAAPIQIKTPPPQATPMPPILNAVINNTKSNILPQVPYGCLKNGIKPTYRNWTKTQKSRTSVAQPLSVTTQKDSLINIPSKSNVKAGNPKRNTKTVTKITRKRRYSCGKSKKYRKVGIVIKSGKMRTNIILARKTLRNRTHTQMRNELHKAGLLRIGSSAPSSLVQTLYENTKLAGEINNNNKDTLIYNYLNGDGDES